MDELARDQFTGSVHPILDAVPYGRSAANDLLLDAVADEVDRGLVGKSIHHAAGGQGRVLTDHTGWDRLREHHNAHIARGKSGQAVAAADTKARVGMRDAVIGRDTAEGILGV